MNEIRKATIKDIETIRQLVFQIYPVAYQDILVPEQVNYMLDLFYSAASLEKQFAQDTFLVALSGDTPVGFASYSLLGAGNYKLHKLYVSAELQGQGVGTELIRFIMKNIQGTVTLELNVNRFNKARVFYEKLGFAVIRAEDIDIGNGYWMNDFVMQRVF